MDAEIKTSFNKKEREYLEEKKTYVRKWRLLKERRWNFEVSILERLLNMYYKHEHVLSLYSSYLIFFLKNR